VRRLAPLKPAARPLTWADRPDLLASWPSTYHG